MTKSNEVAFDNWWARPLQEEQDPLNKSAIRRAFFAGHAVGAIPESKRFVFSAGSRRADVLAPTYRKAKSKAEATLTKRMETKGIRPPVSGWYLQSAVARSAGQLACRR